MPVSNDTSKVTPERKIRGRIVFRLRRVIVALFLALLTILIAAIFLHRALLRFYAPTILESLSTEFREFYDLDFQWVGYNISGLNDFTISGIGITDIPTSTRLLDVDSLRIRTSLIGLSIRGKDPMSGVTSVELIDPVISLARQPDGRWNAGKLFEPGEGEPYQFPGRLSIVIKDGEISWPGGDVAPGFPFPASMISGLDGIFRLETDNSMGVTLDGKFEGENVESTGINIQGSYDPLKNLINLILETDSLDLKLIKPIFNDENIREIGGLADTRVSILIGEDSGENGYSILGHGTVSDGYVLTDYFGIDALGISGDLHYSHQSVFTTGLKCKIRGADVEVSGQIGGFGNENGTTTNIIINAVGVPATYVSEQFQLTPAAKPSGSLKLDCEFFYNSETGMKTVFTASSESLTAFGLPLSIERLDASFENDIFDIRNLQADIFGGTISGDGVFNLDPERGGYFVNVNSSGFPAERLAQYLPEAATALDLTAGSVSAAFSATDDIGSDPKISGGLFVADVGIKSYPGIGVFDLSFPFEYSGGGFNVKGGSLTADGAGVILEGTWAPKSGFVGNVAVTVDDPSFVSRATGIDIRCMFSSAGEFAYSDAGGVGFDGEVYLSGGNFGGLTVPNFGAKLTVEDNIARLSNITGEVNSAEFAGEIVFPLGEDAGESRSAKFTLTGFDVGRMLPPKYRHVITTSMNLDGQVELDNIERNLVAGIKVVEDNAVAGPNMVSTVDRDFLLSLTVPLDNPLDASLKLTGTIESEPSAARIFEGRVLNEYSGRVISHLTNLLVSEASQAPVYEKPQIPVIDGSFELDAEISEIFKTRKGSIGISTSNATIGSINLSESRLSMESVDGANWNVGLDVDARDVGKLQVEGEIGLVRNINNSSLSLSASIADSGIPSLLSLMGFKDTTDMSFGTIEGSGKIEGTLGDPTIENFLISFGQSEAFGIPMNQGEMNFSFDSPKLDVRGLSIQGDEGFQALGEGEVDLSAFSITTASIVLRLDNINLSALSSVTGRKIPLTGIGSASLLLTQDALGPRILYDTRITNLVLTAGHGGLPLGDLVMSAEYRPGDPQVAIRKIELSKSGEKITLSGKLPADFTDAGADLFDINISSESGYTLSAAGDEGLGGFTWDGRFDDIDLNLTGSIATTAFNGGATVDVENVKYGDMDICDSIKGPIDVDDSIASASPEEFSISGDGWELGVSTLFRLTNLRKAVENIIIEQTTGYTVPGTINIADVRLVEMNDNPIAVKGPGFDVLVRAGTGDETPGFRLNMVDSEFGGTIAGGMTILGGWVDIEDVPLFPIMDPETEKISRFNLDLHARLGAELRLQYGKFWNVVCEQAQLDLTGNLTVPILTGSAYAPEGWINVVGNHFVLVEPLEMTVSQLYPPDNPYIRGTASKTFQQVRSPGFYGEELVVTAHIDSSRENMMDKLIENNGLTSVPPLSQDAIMQALLYEDFIFRTISNTLFGTDTMDPGFESIDLGTVLPIATSYLSQYIRQKAGFSDFEISMDQDQNVMVYLETEVFDNVVMYYRQKFGPNAEDDHLWGARYRWRERSWVGFEVNNDEEITPQIQYIIPLD